MSVERAARFWARVDKTAGALGCWVWTGVRQPDGYGNFNGKNLWGTNLAHRIAWILTRGPIPAGTGHHGTCVLHRCDNPPCVNPAHLFLGSIADNNADAKQKGRGAKGTRNGMYTCPERRPRGERQGLAKLTWTQVAEIRARYHGGERSQRRLAVGFGVTKTAIQRIVRGQSWTEPKMVIA